MGLFFVGRRSMTTSIIVVSSSEIVSNVKENNLSNICSSLYKNKQDVKFVETVKPEASVVKSALDRALELSDAVVVVTENEWDKFYMVKHLLADKFGAKIEVSEYAKKYIDDYARTKNIPLQREDNSLAQMPSNARTIKNPFSAYQGCLIEENNKLVFLLPLESDELYHIFFSSVLPYILSKGKQKGKTYILRTFGIKQQELQTLLREEIKNKYEIEVICAEKFLRGEVVVNINEGTRSDAQKNIISKIYTKLLPYFYSEKDESLEEFIIELLSVRNLTISFGEDFTRGAMSSSLGQVQNSDKIFKESYIVISNESKTKLLGVDKDCYNKSKIDYGEIAYEMALGTLENSGADVVATSCGDLEKGLLYFAIGNSEGIHIFSENIQGSIPEKINLATGKILFQLIKKLKQDDFNIGREFI